MLLLSLTLVFALFACEKCKHGDADNYGFCDLCEEQLEVVINDVALIEGGIVNFQFVMGSDTAGETTKAVETLIRNLKKIDVEFEKVTNEAFLKTFVGTGLNEKNKKT